MRAPRIVTVTLSPAIDLVFEASHPLDRAVMPARRRWYAAGKGINVARGVRDRGREVEVLALAGGVSGNLLRDLLKEEGLRARLVAAQAEIRVNATVAWPGDEVHLVEPSPVWTEAELAALVRAVASAEAGTLVVSGHCPLPHGPAAVRAMLAEARSRGVRTVLDTRDEALQRACDERWAPWLVKPNRAELASVAEGDVLSAARALRARMAAEWVLVSLGEEGAVLVGDEVACRSDAPSVTVVNTVGAGDAMVAAVVSCDGGPAEMLANAVAAGTASVGVDAPGAIPREAFARLLGATRAAVRPAWPQC